MAGVEELEEFSRLPEATRHLNPSLRGALAEIAAMGVIRHAGSTAYPSPCDPVPGGPSPYRRSPLMHPSR